MEALWRTDWSRLLLHFLLLLLSLIPSFSCGFDLSQHLNTKSPYFTEYRPGTEEPPLPGQCEASPIFFNYLGRHGSREPTGNDVNVFLDLQQKLEKYGGAVTDPQFQWMKEWKSPYTRENAGLLTNLGEKEHYDTSKRFLARYNNLWAKPYASFMYPIRTTLVSRTARSGSAFGYGVWEGTGDLGVNHYEALFSYSESLSLDYALRFFDICPTYTKSILENTTTYYQSNQFLSSIEGPMRLRLSKVFGYTWEVQQSDLVALYKACAFDISSSNDTTKFCALFSVDDILALEYWDDLATYYERGFGTPLAQQIACPLINDFIAAMENAIDPNALITRVNLRFAHAETLMPFVALLGLFKDSEDLKWNSPESVVQSRKWRGSIISPFAANVAFVMYNCTDGPRVQLLHNEISYEFPGCSGETFCPLSTVKEIYAKHTNCNFELMCGIVGCPSQHNTKQLSGLNNESLMVGIMVGLSSFVLGVFVSVVGVWMFFRKNKMNEEIKKYHKMSTFHE